MNCDIRQPSSSAPLVSLAVPRNKWLGLVLASYLSIYFVGVGPVVLGLLFRDMDAHSEKTPACRDSVNERIVPINNFQMHPRDPLKFLQVISPSFFPAFPAPMSFPTSTKNPQPNTATMVTPAHRSLSGSVLASCFGRISPMLTT